jgi:hypothetical protein
MHANKMKRLFRIFELSKNEQRVVLTVMLLLIAIAFVRYGRRVHRYPRPVEASAGTQAKSSASPAEIKYEQ